MQNIAALIIVSVLLANDTLKVGSSVFVNGGSIPLLYTCEGENVNPPLTILGMPSGTKSLVLIMYDPDAPNGTFVHWVMYDIPPAGQIEENSIPGIQGANSAGKNAYTGPCPPNGTHHYHFKIYALDKFLNQPEGLDRSEVEDAMKGHILASGETIGIYNKKGK